VLNNRIALGKHLPTLFDNGDIGCNGRVSAQLQSWGSAQLQGILECSIL